ncbi:MAG: hypothetical protein AAFO82_02755, partial [Bacteroidota bacterium]
IPIAASSMVDKTLAKASGSCYRNSINYSKISPMGWTRFLFVDDCFLAASHLGFTQRKPYGRFKKRCYY